jgi:hypothetical protein
VNAESDAPVPTLPVAGVTDEDISRALDRLAKARIRLRDVTARVPVASRLRSESIERARRAVLQAQVEVERRAGDPAADKTHALAEIAEVMALRREGFATLADYEEQVAPQVRDAETHEALRRADHELAAAQAQWDEVKVALGDESDADGETVLDLTRDTPTVRKR